MLHSNIGINEKGHLTFAGLDTVTLAGEYGTALYLIDEDRVRSNCRMYTETMTECFGAASYPLYASKALSFLEMYRIAEEEGMGVDVVSPGELYTAIKAGFPSERIYFHGNNKTDEDIRYAIAYGIGYFVVDNYEEIKAISKYACEMEIVQKILLRLTPGIDPHTFAAVNTGKLDSQFGTPIETGQAIRIVGEAIEAPGVELCGFHCHIGSQIFDYVPFCDASDILLDFIVSVRDKYNFVPSVLNIGGGFGVRYTEADPTIDIPQYIRGLAEHIKERFSDAAIELPSILMEPGRSIVADAGMTLYTAGGVKTIDGHRSYVTVDGGMADNPRYALYRSPYTVYSASRATEEYDFLCSVAGRCCESGDLIQENIMLPEPKRGDIIAVAVTGAYNFSMASNYNRLCRPAVVMLYGGESRIAVRRQTFEDLTSCDLSYSSATKRRAHVAAVAQGIGQD